MAGSDDTLERLLTGRCRDPADGSTVSVETRSVVIAPTLAGIEAELVSALGLGRRLAVVSDPTTHAVLGERVERALTGVAALDRVRLPEHPHADAATVARVRAGAADADALIAVGAGTINDLCKCAAAEDGKPYAVFGTAPSMNGYTSANAAVTVAGHKKSLPARVPAGVFLDLRVLAEAPPRMIRSGLGDSLCRPTAQADWLLAHLLLEQRYRELPFALLAADEDALFEHAGELLEGDLEVMAGLARTLVLSGFGMTLCGGSYPASQGEHLISHYVDMLGAPSWPESFHGEQIGVATLSLARLQEHMLEDAQAPLLRAGPDRDAVLAHFGPALGASCWSEFAQKRFDAEAVDAFNALMVERWPVVRERVRAVMRPAAELEGVLARAGAPCTPQALGWPRAFYDEALRHAREIRNRFTFLDLAADAGLLDRDPLPY